MVFCIKHTCKPFCIVPIPNISLIRNNLIAYPTIFHLLGINTGALSSSYIPATQSLSLPDHLTSQQPHFTVDCYHRMCHALPLSTNTSQLRGQDTEMRASSKPLANLISEWDGWFTVRHSSNILGRQSTDQASQVTGSDQRAVNGVLTGGRISPLFGHLGR